MSESNELNFGLPLEEEVENVAEETVDLDLLNDDGSEEEEQNIKGLTKEEYNDPNQIRVTIADENSPLIVLFGPPACGKTMTLVRLARYLNKNGYKISPIKTFRPSDDHHYVELCKPENFNKIINSSDAANSTANVSFMLVGVYKDGKCLCQILESPGEHLFHPKYPTKPFPSYVNKIIHSKNRKLWAVLVEPDWRDDVDRDNYVLRINQLYRQMDIKDKTIFILNMIDKTDFIRQRGQVNIPQAKIYVNTQQYKGIFELFRNQNPITKYWKKYLCGFIPFQTGTYTETSKTDRKGNAIKSFQEGPDYFPQILWNEIKKSITG